MPITGWPLPSPAATIISRLPPRLSGRWFLKLVRYNGEEIRYAAACKAGGGFDVVGTCRRNVAAHTELFILGKEAGFDDDLENLIAARCLDLLKNLPELRAVFDPANFLQCGESVSEAWEMLHGYVDYLHIKDVRADGELVPAGEGEGRLPWLCAQFAAQGGTVMTLEPHLKVFSALSSLEQEGDESAIGTSYATNREAFDAAAAALRKIISAF